MITRKLSRCLPPMTKQDREMLAQMTPIEKQILHLEVKALKAFPSSPRQKEIRAQIEALRAQHPGEITEKWTQSPYSWE